MDFQAPLILGCIVIISVVLFFVYKFGIKEKSYEEALAEQRQQTQALLGIKPPKPNNKDKKNKKAAKKQNKEKQAIENEPTTSDDQEIDKTDPEQQSNKKHHVEFKEETVEVPLKDPITPPKKRVKKDKVRPILISKDTKSTENLVNLTNDIDLPPANHFEELHPKDEFELLRSSSTDSLKQDGKIKTKLVDESKSTKTKNPPLPVEQEVVKTVAKKVNASTSPLPTGVTVTTPTPPPQPPQVEKEKDEKRNESSITAPVNGLVPTTTAKEKKKKKSEINALQQLTGDGNGPNMSLLLNLVRKAELSRSEVQILIDLLLNKQHEAPAILDEWSEGKSDPVQKLKKQLAEKEKLLADEQEALLGAQNKLREVRAEQQSERTQLQQKIRNFDELLQTKQQEINRLHQQLQQLQGQLKDELMKSHKLRDEIAAVQMQRQQFEMSIAQAQEAEVVIAQLQNDNQQLRLELNRLSEENNAEKEANNAFLLRLGNFQKELEMKNEHIRKLEESRAEVEHNLEKALRQENDFKIEISRLNTACKQQLEECRRLEHTKIQYQDETYRLQKEKDELQHRINELINEIEQLRNEKLQLQTEKANGTLEENKQREIEILNLHNELQSTKNQLQETRNNYENQLQAINLNVNQLQNQLEEQKAKNNALRTRNWKVMEALNVAENRLKSCSNLDKNVSEQEIIQLEFIQRLFPEIKELKSLKQHDFLTDSEKLIRDYIESLKKTNKEEQKQEDSKSDSNEEVRQLESQIQHYKNTIDNAEKMLNRLQKHIEQEEINWRVQLAAKTAEVDALKANNNPSQLEEKVVRLERELIEEQEKKTELINELANLRSQSSNSNTIIEKLSEEINNLQEELQKQTIKTDDCPKLQIGIRNGPATTLQYCVSSSSSVASSLSEFSIKKSKNKKKKKKESSN